MAKRCRELITGETFYYLSTDNEIHKGVTVYNDCLNSYSVLVRLGDHFFHIYLNKDSMCYPDYWEAWAERCKKKKT